MSRIVQYLMMKQDIILAGEFHSRKRKSCTGRARRHFSQCVNPNPKGERRRGQRCGSLKNLTTLKYEETKQISPFLPPEPDDGSRNRKKENRKLLTMARDERLPPQKTRSESAWTVGRSRPRLRHCSLSNLSDCPVQVFHRGDGRAKRITITGPSIMPESSPYLLRLLWHPSCRKRVIETNQRERRADKSGFSLLHT